MCSRCTVSVSSSPSPKPRAALGNSGTGKTHIALALGLAACQRGMRVRFTTASALVHELIEARDEKRLLRFQKHLLRQDLLMVDELGLVPLSKTGAEMLFEVFSQRYEMDRGAGERAADGRVAGPADAPRAHPGDEWGKLPAEDQQAEASGRPGPLVLECAPACLGHLALRPTRSAYGLAGLRSRRPQHAHSSPVGNAESGPLFRRPSGSLLLRP